MRVRVSKECKESLQKSAEKVSQGINRRVLEDGKGHQLYFGMLRRVCQGSGTWMGVRWQLAQVML